MKAAVARVPSLSTPGRSHDVERLPDGRLVCDCPRFAFGPREGKSCSHTRIVASAEHLVAACREQHGTEHGGACLECVVSLLAATASKVRRQYVDKQKLKDAKEAKRDAKVQRRAARRKGGRAARPRVQVAAREEPAGAAGGAGDHPADR